MTQYEKQKQAARIKAQEWQQDTSPKSWGEIAQEKNKLEKLAKRYGLIKEFRENGII